MDSMLCGIYGYLMNQYGRHVQVFGVKSSEFKKILQIECPDSNNYKSIMHCKACIVLAKRQLMYVKKAIGAYNGHVCVPYSIPSGAVFVAV